MSVSTLPRPAGGSPAGAGPGSLPGSVAGVGLTAPTGPGVPAGAVRMQSWYIDAHGRRMRTAMLVPVDGDDARTAHQLHRCPRHAVCGAQEWLLAGETRFCPLHGQQLATSDTRVLRRRMLVREYVRLHGASTAPWTVLAGAVGTVAALRVADASAAVSAGLVPAAAGTAYLIARRVLRSRAIRAGRIMRGQRDGRRVRQITLTARTVAAVTAAAGTWAVVTAAADPATWPGRALWTVALTGWAVGCYPWWARAERRRQAVLTTKLAPAVPTVPVVTVDPWVEQVTQVWASLIGRQGGPLAGTHLVDVQRLPGSPAGEAGRVRAANWTATVRATVAGSMNMRESRPQLLGRIAAAYGCTYGDVSFTADESNLSLAYLRVQPDNVLAEVRLYQGPDAANDWTAGRSVVGRFEDGAPMVYQWWTSLGATHTLLSGCTGSGKSELASQAFVASLHSHGLVLDWLGDPQGGQSYGVLKNHVDYFARDKSEIVRMLLAAKKEMLRRNDALAAANVKTWTPTTAMPLLVVTVDEAQSVLDDPIAVELVEDLIGQGRKCGIGLRLMTQVPYAYALGDSTYIREQLFTGQVFTFRAATAIAARAAADADSPIDPQLLPDKWGKGTCNPGETTAGLCFVQGVNGRDVYGRTDHTGPDTGVWLRDPTTGASTTSPGRFSREAQEVSGPLWGGRHARYQAALAAGRNDADLLRNGKALDLIRAAADLAAGGQHAGAMAALNQVVAAQSARPETRQTKDIVYAAACAAADAHPQGQFDRKAIVALTPTLATSTRDRAIGDLIAEGRLDRATVAGRPRNGIFTILGRPITAGTDQQ